MAEDQSEAIRARIQRIEHLTSDDQGSHEYLEAGSLALTVLNDTAGGSHPCVLFLIRLLNRKIGRSLLPLAEQL